MELVLKSLSWYMLSILIVLLSTQGAQSKLSLDLDSQTLRILADILDAQSETQEVKQIGGEARTPQEGTLENKLDMTGVQKRGIFKETEPVCCSMDLFCFACRTKRSLPVVNPYYRKESSQKITQRSKASNTDQANTFHDDRQMLLQKLGLNPSRN